MDKDGYHGYDKDAEIKRLNEKIEFLARTNMLYSDWEHRETQVTSDLIRKGIEATKIKASDEALMTVALEAIEGFIPYLPLDDTDQMARYDQAVKGLTKRLKDKNTRGQE
jgi:hypothetical protein